MLLLAHLLGIQSQHLFGCEAAVPNSSSVRLDASSLMNYGHTTTVHQSSRWARHLNLFKPQRFPACQCKSTKSWTCDLMCGQAYSRLCSKQSISASTNPGSLVMVGKFFRFWMKHDWFLPSSEQMCKKAKRISV